MTDDPLLTPAEVAALFRVNAKTVTRWSRAGKIPAVFTLGGHRRFRASAIRRAMEAMLGVESNHAATHLPVAGDAFDAGAERRVQVEHGSVVPVDLGDDDRRLS